MRPLQLPPCGGPTFARAVPEVVVGAIVTLLCGTASADWVGFSGAENAPTVAELHVEATRAVLRIEIHRDDLRSFGDMAGAAADAAPPASAETNRPPLPADLPAPAPAALQADGVELSGTILAARWRLRTDRVSPYGTPADPARVPFVRPPEDPWVYAIEIAYPLPRGTRTLTVLPPLKSNGFPAATIGFIAHHRGVPVTDYAYLSGPEDLHLDPDDPWYSAFANRNLNRHHRAPIMSFLYVEPHEIRHEVLARVRDLDRWAGLGLAPGAPLEPDGHAALKARIGEFLRTRNTVRIDGASPSPLLDRVDFVAVGPGGTQILVQPGTLDAATALVGVSLVWPRERLPREIDIDWDLFDARIGEVPAVLTDPAGAFQTVATREQPAIRWRNALTHYQPPEVAPVAVASRTVPAPALALAAAGTILGWRQRRRPVHAAIVAGLTVIGALTAWPHGRLDIGAPSGATALAPADAQRVVAATLRNVYRAFDFVREEDAYDRLAVSATGDVLADLYLQHRRTLVLEEQGGVRARVNAVEIEALEPLPADGGRPRFRCAWTAGGTVGHWGHVHRRRNRYEAELTFVAAAGAWKIAALQLLDSRRLDAPAARPPS